jgi:hypothetical protein
MSTSATISTSLSTLTRIQTKTRRLTASPSQNQLSDSELNDYINTFYLFDFPENIRLFNLRDTYEFYTDPYVDVYPFPRNTYTNIYQPLYIGGYQSFFTQSREQYFRIYPQLDYSETVGTGDGTTNSFSFTLSNFPVIRGFKYPPAELIHSQVFISYSDNNNNSIISRDNGLGGFISEDGSTLMAGTIDYITGAVTGLSFTAIPQDGATITAQYVAFVASRPEAICFFNDVFILRPIPDKAYKVSMEVQVQPTAFLASDNSIPNNSELEEWWQFLAFGAAKKILEDRQDMSTLMNIMPMYEEQKRLCLRRTTQQLTQERSATIYTEQTQFPYGNFFNRF